LCENSGPKEKAAAELKLNFTKTNEASMIDPEIGFTSNVITDPNRFVGRTDVIRDCIKALNTPNGLIAVFGKRGVGKSSLMRQIQQMAIGDYSLVKKAGMTHEIPARPRKYLTVYYTCDALIQNANDLVSRICTDQHEEDGLIRLVPNDGKEIIEFTRSIEASGGLDLKVVNWGAKGIESSKYAKVVEGDAIQTFRNFIQSIVSHQVKSWMKRDALLIILDEFDVLQNKDGIGSLIKSLSSENVKFAICGIGKDLHDLVTDHASVERLIEEGAINVKPMSKEESAGIIRNAEMLFDNQILFHVNVINQITVLSQGYPYLTQLFGKECVHAANKAGVKLIDENIFKSVLDSIKSGQAFPTLERQYQRAIGDSDGRKWLLYLLSEQPEDNAMFNDDVGRVVLKNVRTEARELDIDYVDQLLPRLLDRSFGPVIERVPEKPGIYEFINPTFRAYVKLRKI
jgi:Cdc6-like AAA superfamily ATPase